MLFNPLPRPSRTPNPNSPRSALIAAVLATAIAAVGLALGTAGRSDAGAEGSGNRIVVHGGGAAEGAFEKRLPGVTVTTVVADGEGRVRVGHPASADNPATDR